MTTKKSAAKKIYQPPPYVKVYFSGNGAALPKQIEALSKKYGISSSLLCAWAIRQGLPLVKKNLSGLVFDLEFQSKENSKGDSVFVK